MIQFLLTWSDCTIHDWVFCPVMDYPRSSVVFSLMLSKLSIRLLCMLLMSYCQWSRHSWSYLHDNFPFATVSGFLQIRSPWYSLKQLYLLYSLARLHYRQMIPLKWLQVHFPLVLTSCLFVYKPLTPLVLSNLVKIEQAIASTGLQRLVDGF